MTLDRSPNASLRRIGTNTRATVDRIMSTWERATPSDVESGATWYGDAHDVVDAIVAARPDLTREHAAAIIAHLSPRTPWGRNVAGAMALVTTGAAPGCLTANVARATVALTSADPLATLKGPKIRRFALNILGDREAVTVDVWAARVALGDRFEDPEILLTRVGVFDAVEHAYRLAARRAGVDPTTMQATTWVVARNGRSS